VEITRERAVDCKIAQNKYPNNLFENARKNFQKKMSVRNINKKKLKKILNSLSPRLRR
jgi:hypothetical protein